MCGVKIQQMSWFLLGCAMVEAVCAFGYGCMRVEIEERMTTWLSQHDWGRMCGVKIQQMSWFLLGWAIVDVVCAFGYGCMRVEIEERMTTWLSQHDWGRMCGVKIQQMSWFLLGWAIVDVVGAFGYEHMRFEIEERMTTWLSQHDWGRMCGVKIQQMSWFLPGWTMVEVVCTFAAEFGMDCLCFWEFLKHGHEMSWAIWSVREGFGASDSHASCPPGPKGPKLYSFLPSLDHAQTCSSNQDAGFPPSTYLFDEMCVQIPANKSDPVEFMCFTSSHTPGCPGLRGKTWSYWSQDTF